MGSCCRSSNKPPLQSRDQRDSRFSRILKNFFHFRFRSRAVSISPSLLEKEWRDFIFHFSLLEKKVKATRISLFFSRKKWNQAPGIISPLSLRERDLFQVINLSLSTIEVRLYPAPDFIFFSRKKSEIRVAFTFFREVKSVSNCISKDCQISKYWPKISFSTKLLFIRSSSVATWTTVATSTIFQLTFNGRTWIW